MTLFFLAYTATADIRTSKGWRIFETEANTPTEIGNALEDKLFSIRKELGMDEIIATAFNKL